MKNYPHATVASVENLRSLRLDSNTLLDFWIGYWQIINTNTPIQVEKQRPVLLRLRPSLTEELADCPGLSDELSRQLKYRTSSKRLADTTLVSPPKKMPKITDKKPLGATTVTASTVIEIDSDSSDADLDTNSTGHKDPLPPRLLASSSSSQKASAISASHSRQWPSAYTLLEIQTGLDRIKRMAREEIPRTTEKAAFSLVFSGCDYKKSTVTRVKQKLATTQSDKFELYKSKTWALFLKTDKDAICADRENTTETFKSDTSPTSSSTSAVVNARREVSLEYLTPPPPNHLDLKNPSDSSGSLAARTSPLISRVATPAVFPELPPLSGDSFLDPVPGDIGTTDHNGTNSFLGELLGYDPNIPHCEFCDEPITTHPSRMFLAMREKMLKLSWPDPIPGNPNHRRASHFTVYQEYCNRHELEMNLLPKAQAAGWPLAPSFSTLYIRILKHHRSLENDILNASTETIDTNTFFRKVAGQYQEQSSSLAAEGMKQQLANYGSSVAGTG